MKLDGSGNQVLWLMFRLGHQGIEHIAQPLEREPRLPKEARQLDGTSSGTGWAKGVAS